MPSLATRAQHVPFIVTPQAEKIYHQLDFCIRHFPECTSHIYAIGFNPESGYFRLQGSHSRYASLPEDWSHTEVETKESRYNGNGYDNTWGFTTFLGPKSLIDELALAERLRREADIVVRELLPGGCYGDISRKQPTRSS
jgi:hypothetical protein